MWQSCTLYTTTILTTAVIVILGVISTDALPMKAIKMQKYFHNIKQEAEYPFPYVNREAWGSRPPRAVTKLKTPVPLVVIHHTYSPGQCRSRDECNRAMRVMQLYHQDQQQWNDIGYNFAVGGDDSVYEGRGWNAVGAHAAGHNSESIGIVLIGDWVEKVPPRSQLHVAQQLISYGVERGFISPNYTLVGHRQLGSTECPGTALFGEISHWTHFNETL